MAIIKFQRSRLTFDIFAKLLILESRIVFSQAIGPIELKFDVKTSYDNLVKIYTKYLFP